MDRVFICYSRKDTDFVDRLVSDLQAAGVSTWRDVDDIPGHVRANTTGWRDAVQEGLELCTHMIVVVSPDSINSPEVNAEWNYFLEQGKKVYPVFHREGKMPYRLFALNWWDFRQDYNQPLASLLGVLPHEVHKQPPIPISSPAYNTLPQPIESGEPIEPRRGGAQGLAPLPHDETPIRKGEERTDREVEAEYIPPLLATEQTLKQSTSRESDALPSSGKHSLSLPWIWIGGIGVLVVAGIIGLITILGNGEAEPPITEEPIQTEEIAAEEEFPEPAATPLDKPIPTPDPAWVTIAEAGVTNNNQWEPYIQEFGGVQMALVPAGCFMMGSEEYDDEQPVHQVCFEEPFWIDVYEVTNEAFGSVGCESISSEPDQPRTCISWTDALAHCQIRNARLPTEAEWEYAARGPDGLVYPWGYVFVADYVVYDGKAAAVGSKPGGVSWVGALDLSGNAWELVNDYMGGIGYDEDSLVINPQGPDAGVHRVLRGGSWDDSLPEILRSANRSSLRSGTEDDVGFRCARDYSTENTNAESSPTVAEDIPTPTVEPVRNPAFVLAEAGVSSNDEWEPYIQDFDGVQMALVPAGCFMMGSEDGNSDEQPVHRVCFDEPFWIDIYEVTNRQYGATGCEDYSSEPNQPRNCVSWFEAVDHCESRNARLPTEAEWEYAARGSDGLAYPWGIEFNCNKGNFDDETKYDSKVIDGGVNCDSYIETAPVGSFPSGISWIGAYDLSGNVWEWVSNWYEGYPSDQQMNPQGPESGVYRVRRGGSWDDFLSFLPRSAYRSNAYPDSEDKDLGFRCARDYEP